MRSLRAEYCAGSWSLNPESGDTGGLITDWITANPEEGKLKVLEGLSGTRVPTTTERVHAASLFSVSALPPPVPSPLPSPPPVVSPPRDTTFDFLFDDVSEDGVESAKSAEGSHSASASASEPGALASTSRGTAASPPSMPTTATAHKMPLHASLSRISAASAAAHISTPKVAPRQPSSSVAVTTQPKVEAELPVSTDLRQSFGTAQHQGLLQREGFAQVRSVVPFALPQVFSVGIVVVIVAIIVAVFARGRLYNNLAFSRQRRERVPTFEDADVEPMDFADMIDEADAADEERDEEKDQHVTRI